MIEETLQSFSPASMNARHGLRLPVNAGGEGCGPVDRYFSTREL